MSEVQRTISQRAESSQRAAAHTEQPQLLMARRLDQVVRRAPVSCPLGTPIRDVLAILDRDDIGSMLVTFPDGRLAGIFTLRDLLTRVAVPGHSASEPIESVMTPSPVTLPSHVFALDAALAMARHGVHHIVVADGARIVGLVSEKDLFALQQAGITQISIALREARSIGDLAELAGSVRALAGHLLEQGVGAEALTRIVATLNDVLSRRVIELELTAAGAAAEKLCWISLGSEGRHEQTLATDQDNGIIFDSQGGDAAVVRSRLVPIARKINEDLDACGFPLCRGEVMASNPRWCLSAAEWRDAFRHWIFSGQADAILNATIFFDFRALYGDAALATELRDWLTTAAAENRRFLRQLAENALRNRPPLGIVRDFRVSDRSDKHPHTINLKINGATLFIDAARVWALSSGVRETNTVRRLEAWVAKVPVPRSEVEAWTGAFNFLQLTRLRHQHRQLMAGTPADNDLDPDRLNGLDRRILRESLKLAKTLQARLALDYRL